MEKRNNKLGQNYAKLKSSWVRLVTWFLKSSNNVWFLFNYSGYCCRCWCRYTSDIKANLVQLEKILIGAGARTELGNKMYNVLEGYTIQQSFTCKNCSMKMNKIVPGEFVSSISCAITVKLYITEIDLYLSKQSRSYSPSWIPGYFIMIITIHNFDTTKHTPATLYSSISDLMGGF